MQLSGQEALQDLGQHRGWNKSFPGGQEEGEVPPMPAGVEDPQWAPVGGV